MGKGHPNWTTYTQYVDEHTGELITQQNAKKNYLVIKTKIVVEYERAHRIRRITKICRRDPQARFW